MLTLKNGNQFCCEIRPNSDNFIIIIIIIVVIKIPKTNHSTYIPQHWTYKKIIFPVLYVYEMWPLTSGEGQAL
jgi:hypothetical protein